MVKKIRCKISANDWVNSQVSRSGKNIKILMSGGDEQRAVILTPADARKLRKQIKKALEAIEGDGGEAEEPKDDPHQYSVGDKVRIVGNKWEKDDIGHEFNIGDIVTITKIDQEDHKQPYQGNESWDGWLAADDIDPA